MALELLERSNSTVKITGKYKTVVVQKHHLYDNISLYVYKSSPFFLRLRSENRLYFCKSSLSTFLCPVPSGALTSAVNFMDTVPSEASF